MNEQRHMVPSGVYLHYQGPMFPVPSSQDPRFLGPSSESTLTHVNPQCTSTELPTSCATPLPPCSITYISHHFLRALTHTFGSSYKLMLIF